MIEFHSGDMWGMNADYRVNPVNCKGVMGAGLAAAFKLRYPPHYFSEYANDCVRGVLKPGTLTTYTDTWTTIINLPTKDHWKDGSSLRLVEASLQALRTFLRDKGSSTITIPALGCGHGGLEWERVKPMMVEQLRGLDARIHIFEPSEKWFQNWFSNMLECDPFTYQGISFSTVENFYQAMKLEKKQVALRRKFAAMEPHQAKKQIRDYPQRPDWNEALALQVMEYGLRQKFAVGTKWHQQLISLREPIIEFNNWGDETWGVDLRTGKGSNQLGRLLMQIREEAAPSPLATDISQLVTPRQLTMLRGAVTDADAKTRFGGNIELAAITRRAAQAWLDELEKQFAKELFA